MYEFIIQKIAQTLTYDNERQIAKGNYFRTNPLDPITVTTLTTVGVRIEQHPR